LNLTLLMAGSGIGQGSLLLAQTWLLATRQFDLLSWFGTQYAFAILGIILTDGGTSTILTREIALVSRGVGTADTFWRTFNENFLFRLILVSAVSILTVIICAMMPPGGFSRAYLLTALPALWFWTGNAVGLLDGLKLSGLSGLTASFANAASAIALVVLPSTASPELAGYILGISFSGGYFLTVLVQWIILRNYDWIPRFMAVSVNGLALTSRNGCAMLLQLAPGQILGRVQLALSMTYLGAETTALYAYVKQIIGAMTMVVAFVLRVDFPGLVQRVAHGALQSFWIVFTAQKTSLACTAVLTIGTVLVSWFISSLPDNRFAAAAATLLVFSPTIATLLLSYMLLQAMVALGDYTRVATVTVVTASIGIAVSYLLVARLGLYAFLTGELIFHFLGFVFMANALSQRAGVGRRGPTEQSGMHHCPAPSSNDDARHAPAQRPPTPAAPNEPSGSPVSAECHPNDTPAR
jgi:hypothetical protein